MKLKLLLKVRNKTILIRAKMIPMTILVIQLLLMLAKVSEPSHIQKCNVPKLTLLLSQNPNVILLDEPSNDLDLDTIQELENFLIDKYDGVDVRRLRMAARASDSARRSKRCGTRLTRAWIEPRCADGLGHQALV